MNATSNCQCAKCNWREREEAALARSSTRAIREKYVPMATRMADLEYALELRQGWVHKEIHKALGVSAEMLWCTEPSCRGAVRLLGLHPPPAKPVVRPRRTDFPRRDCSVCHRSISVVGLGLRKHTHQGDPRVMGKRDDVMTCHGSGVGG